MTPKTPIIERAYQLARSGRYGTILDLKAALRAEGHERIDQHFAGRGLVRALAKLMAEARDLRSDDPEAPAPGDSVR